jgi:hypothetical protein
MICEGCANDHASVLNVRYQKDGRKICSCNRCGASLPYVADVYFKEPYWDENLATEDHPGAKFIASRGDKKFWLDKCKLREAGDRVHGATSFDKISHRVAMESLQKRRTR